MSTETITIIRDDIDRSEGAIPIKFGFDGKSYVVDLAEHNVTKLRDALDPFIQVARVDRPLKAVAPITRQAPAPTSNGTSFVVPPPASASEPVEYMSNGHPKPRYYRSNVDYDRKTLLHWASKHGVTIPKRGAVAGSIIERFLTETARA